MEECVAKIVESIPFLSEVHIIFGDKRFGGDAYGVNPVSLGQARQAAHPNGTERFYEGNDDIEDIIGLYGERQFGIEFGLPVDVSIRPTGDRHIDFYAQTAAKVVKTVDVKTARLAYNLLVKEWEMGDAADILVLCGFDGDPLGSHSQNLIGWEEKAEMAKCPVRDFGYGIPNYHKRRSVLKPMSALKDILGVRRQPLQWMGVREMVVAEMSNRGFRLVSQNGSILVFKGGGNSSECGLFLVTQ
jgi:hypothetical protein